MPINLDDFEVDFEAALGRLADEVSAGIERDTAGMLPDQRRGYFIEKALNHWARMLQLRAPRFLITQARKRVEKLIVDAG